MCELMQNTMHHTVLVVEKWEQVDLRPCLYHSGTNSSFYNFDGDHKTDSYTVQGLQESQEPIL